MRKTILIGLIAIAMQFAFTACDNSPAINPLACLWVNGRTVNHIINDSA